MRGHYKFHVDLIPCSSLSCISKDVVGGVGGIGGIVSGVGGDVDDVCH